MMIVWDEPKRLANLDKHGLDFADLTPDFFEAALVFPAKASRYIALGRLPNGAVAVVFARYGAEGISIISMRKASLKERKLL